MILPPPTSVHSNLLQKLGTKRCREEKFPKTSCRSTQWVHPHLSPAPKYNQCKKAHSETGHFRMHRSLLIPIQFEPNFDLKIWTWSPKFLLSRVFVTKHKPCCLALLVTIWFKEVSVRECHVSILSGRQLIKKSATSLICQILRGVMGALPVSKVFTQLQDTLFRIFWKVLL